MKLLIAVLVFVSLSLALRKPARAESLPNPSIAQMCKQVDLIIEGKWQGGKRVTVTRVWRIPGWLHKDLKELEVNGLRELTRVPSSFYTRFTKPEHKPKELTTKNVTLFLALDEQSHTWSPLYLIRDGSPGAIWWDETACYHYQQITNPGLYHLLPWNLTERETQNGIARGVGELRQAIEAGLKIRERFQEDLKIADPGKRAEVLVRYLLPRTTPDPSGTHRYAAEEAVGKLGKPAIPALIAAIQAAPPEEEIQYLLTPLWRIGADSTAATPVLLKVLDRKDKNAGSCIVALERISDRTNAPHIRPFLRADDSTTRFLAARALAKLDDKLSFDAIAELIPVTIKSSEIYEVRDVLNSLYALDPAKARPLAVKVGAKEAMGPVRDQIDALKNPN